MYDEKYEKLKFTNDFMFSKVMRDATLCQKLLEVILNLKIDHIEYPEEQKTIDLSLDSKSIRLDVYAKDTNNTVYNIEMQTTNPKNLPKRSRYYQGMIDLNLIEKGENYNKLNKSYVIFICTEDFFGLGRHIYTFKNLCVEDPTLVLGDETIKVFLNASSIVDDIDTELANFLSYVSTGEPKDKFTKDLESALEAARNNEEWRREYMTLHMREQEIREEGKLQLDIFKELINRLLSANRIADAQLAATDEDAKERLLKEFGLSK
ncbi:MAG: Rpn family recombination-promoting nuclease/putative transposase [Lachnospiraceae bacterium]|nr:Rpn family recombination-promoting nuclease/putative transposase [Lachnospiraceae bacterium]